MVNEKRFVIHHHSAEKDHFDLRLEIDGQFHSWAFTKGLSTDSAVRRMGIKIENVDLGKFEYEGEMTEEKYGSGTVLVWDRGTYSNIRAENGDNLGMRQSLEDGHIKVFLKGTKLEGGFTLIDVPYGKTKWLQVKEADEYVDKSNNIMTKQPDSILSTNQ